jgi:hypothetical protein
VLPALPVAKSKTDLGVLPSMADRHGLIAGAAGTGKTLTLQRSIFDKVGFPDTGGGAKGRTRESPLEAAAKSAARAMGSEVGRRIIRGVPGSILGGRR